MVGIQRTRVGRVFGNNNFMAITRVYAAADRRAHDAETQRMLNIPYRIIIKPFRLLGLAAEYRSRRWAWSTVVRRPSEVYDTHRRIKLTAPQTIGCSRDMIVAQQNLNGSRDVTTPLSGMVCHLLPSVYPPNVKSLTPLNTKIWKVIQNDKNNVVWGS